MLQSWRSLRRRCKLSVIVRENALQIVRTLVDAGHVALFAGGCVRDMLMGVDPDDYVDALLGES